MIQLWPTDAWKTIAFEFRSSVIFVSPYWPTVSASYNTQYKQPVANDSGFEHDPLTLSSPYVMRCDGWCDAVWCGVMCGVVWLWCDYVMVWCDVICDVVMTWCDVIMMWCDMWCDDTQISSSAMVVVVVTMAVCHECNHWLVTNIHRRMVVNTKFLALKCILPLPLAHKPDCTETNGMKIPTNYDHISISCQ